MVDANDTSRHLAAVLAGVVYEAIEEAHRYESGLPHVLVCTDLLTGDATVSGPFHSLDAAERVADHERCSAGADSTLSFHASPLYPPLDLASRGHDNSRTRLELAGPGSLAAAGPPIVDARAEGVKTRPVREPRTSEG